jgi:hypothetical protein
MDRDSITRTGARAPGVERHASLERRCITESSSPTLIGACCRTTGCTKDGGKPCGGKGMPGAGLTEPPYGKAPSDRPALKPYWGKPAVRNFRGDDGNVGIMRSPVRAIVLPGKSPCPDLARGRGGKPPGLLYNAVLAPRRESHLPGSRRLGRSGLLQALPAAARLLGTAQGMPPNPLSYT